MQHFVLRNTPFGIWFGATFAFVLALLFDSSLAAEAKRNFTYLATALVSMMSAGFALGGVFMSIRNQSRLADQQRANKLLSARAFLPTSLSRMHEVCRRGLDYSHNFEHYESDLGREKFGQLSGERLELPDEVISVFRDMIELEEKEAVRNRLAGIIREYQVFKARWDSLFHEGWQNYITTERDIRQRTVAWAYLCSLVNSLYDYSRNETDKPLFVDADFITSSFNNITPPSVHSDDFRNEIELYARVFLKRFQ